jgi:glycine betaine/proline transport system permease protein
MPSSMAGINQTILMNLSMVVVASFMEAEGVGARILQALQYVAKGQGLIGGLATLFCAMVIDKIAQGSYRQGHKKTDRGYRTASTIVTGNCGLP